MNNCQRIDVAFQIASMHVLEIGGSSELVEASQIVYELRIKVLSLLPPKPAVKCPDCEGTGKIETLMSDEDMGLAPGASSRPCPTCCSADPPEDVKALVEESQELNDELTGYIPDNEMLTHLLDSTRTLLPRLAAALRARNP